MASETRLIWSEPGCQIDQISYKRWGAAVGDEVAVGVHGVFPLPLGMERYGKGGQVSRSRDLEGVHGIRNTLDLEVMSKEMFNTLT